MVRDRPNTFGDDLSEQRACDNFNIIRRGSEGDDDTLCVFGNGDLFVRRVSNNDHMLPSCDDLFDSLLVAKASSDEIIGDDNRNTNDIEF